MPSSMRKCTRWPRLKKSSSSLPGAAASRRPRRRRSWPSCSASILPAWRPPSSTRSRSARGDLAPTTFGRRDFGLGPLNQRLYGCRIVPGLFHTQGGLAVDLDGRVLDTQGRPIPNLFAGGGAAGGLSGRSGAAGYASGNGLLSAIALGRLAGLAAAAEVREKTHDLVAPASSTGSAPSRSPTFPPTCSRVVACICSMPSASRLASAGTGVGRPYLSAAATLGGPGPANILGSSLTRDAATAALLNGGLMHGLEYDDTHTGFDRARKCRAGAGGAGGGAGG